MIQKWNFHLRFFFRRVFSYHLMKGLLLRPFHSPSICLGSQRLPHPSHSRLSRSCYPYWWGGSSEQNNLAQLACPLHKPAYGFEGKWLLVTCEQSYRILMCDCEHPTSPLLQSPTAFRSVLWFLVHYRPNEFCLVKLNRRYSTNTFSDAELNQTLQWKLYQVVDPRGTNPTLRLLRSLSFQASGKVSQNSFSS